MIKMKVVNNTSKIIQLALVAFLCYGLSLNVPARAQYRWHSVLPTQIDTFYYGYGDVSCHGENCTVIGVRYGENTIDSNVFFHSTDGGETWSAIDSVPEWFITSSQDKTQLVFEKIQQIDSLNAIAVDISVGLIIRTFDGWKTMRQDTIHPDTIGTHVYYKSLYDVDFSNPAEGMVNEGFGWFLSTIDSGKHWTQVVTPNGAAFHSYGNSMFRVFSPQSTLFTTHDNWATIDTSYISYNGPLNDPQVSAQIFFFCGADSVGFFGIRWDSSHTNYSAMMGLSTNLGQSWSELPLPTNEELNPQLVSEFNQNPIVVAGVDSLGQIVMSTDHGVTWQAETVPLENGRPYYQILSIAVTQSGRVLAAIIPDSGYGNVLAYLEQTPNDVKTVVTSPDIFTIFPNPATNEIQISSTDGNISILDPLGRIYSVTRNRDELDISALPSGVYFISDGHSRAKFVKE
jgi:photosystem II stability/assembly factor-like uncharacterized protein